MDVSTPEDKAAFNGAVALVLMLRRAELAMTLPAVAEASGITVVSTQRFLRGDREINMGNFVALAHALDLDPADVLDAAGRQLD